jgi:flagella basal body P-ring formation protein FlgA
VEDDRILGKHLAGVLKEFLPLPPESFIGAMPPAGSKRTFHVPELTSLAQRYSIQLQSPREVCFEWPMEPLDQNRMLQAMRDSLNLTDARIEISETSRNDVPRGRLEFRRESLGRPASPAQIDPVLWRGEVVYGRDHRYAVWAKVRVLAPCERTVALEDLKPGRMIEPRQFRVEQGECFPAPANAAQTTVSPAGMIPSRAINSGAEIRGELLSFPNDVNRGDAVHVEVRSGAAHVALTAKAETAGRAGDFIMLRNPSSNKLFRARVEGKDQVVVQTDSIETGQR